MKLSAKYHVIVISSSLSSEQQKKKKRQRVNARIGSSPACPGHVSGFLMGHPDVGSICAGVSETSSPLDVHESPLQDISAYWIWTSIWNRKAFTHLESVIQPNPMADLMRESLALIERGRAPAGHGPVLDHHAVVFWEALVVRWECRVSEQAFSLRVVEPTC